MPVELKINATGPAVVPERFVTRVETVCPEHVIPAKVRKVTVPVAPNPELMVAVSEAEFPTIMELADRVVVMDGDALATVRLEQALDTGVLLLSPL